MPRYHVELSPNSHTWTVYDSRGGSRMIAECRTQADAGNICLALTAAPDLLAALHGVADRLTRAVQDGDVTRIVRALEIARAAVATAEGLLPPPDSHVKTDALAAS